MTYGTSQLPAVISLNSGFDVLYVGVVKTNSSSVEVPGLFGLVEPPPGRVGSVSSVSSGSSSSAGLSAAD